MGENSKFCNFWAISTCYTSKESIFHIEFNFLLKDMIFLKKNWKKSSFHFFFKQIILFQYKIEFYVKNAFFWGIACWNGCKITKFGIFAHFSWFLSRFLFFTIFLMILRKKIFSLEFLFNLCSDITKTW